MMVVIFRIFLSIPECYFCLGVYDIPASGHELWFFKKPRLRQQETGVPRGEAGLQILDTLLGQVGDDVLLGSVQRGQHVVGL